MQFFGTTELPAMDGYLRHEYSHRLQNSATCAI